MFAALVGPCEACVPADQVGEPDHPLLGRQVLRRGPVQARRGDHPLPVLPSSKHHLASKPYDNLLSGEVGHPSRQAPSSAGACH